MSPAFRNPFLCAETVYLKHGDNMVEKIPRWLKGIGTDAVIEKQGKILLIKRGKSACIGKLALPGGRNEMGELVEQTVVREVKEETGLNVVPIEILGVYSDPKRDPRGEIISITFICKIVNGSIKAGDDAAEVDWYSFEDIREEDMAFDHYKIIQDYLKWKKQKGTYWSSK